MKLNLIKHLPFLILGGLFVISSTTRATTWDWEDGTLQGWKASRSSLSNGDTTAISNSADKAYNGTHSLKWNMKGFSSNTYWFVTVENPKLNPGEIVYYHVWVPDFAQISGLKTFAIDSSGSWVDGTWYGYSGLQKKCLE